MQVSFRIKNLKSNEVTGTVGHDFRKKVHDCIDKYKFHNNLAVIGGFQDIQASISEQAERVKTRTDKKLRKDANLFLSRILMFSALQQNLWGPPGGSGRDPSVWYSAI